ncbi:MAG: AraC family transcriptional regulator [Minicystis sp.]
MRDPTSRGARAQANAPQVRWPSGPDHWPESPAEPRSRVDARPRPASSVLAAWIERLVDLAAPADQRLDLRRELEAARDARDPDARLPYRLVAEMWDRLTATHPDPAFGLSFAEQIAIRDLGITGYFASTAETLGEAFDRVLRFHRLLKDPSEISITTTPTGIHVVEGPPPGESPFPRHLAEAILATYVVLGRRWTAAPLPVLSVRFCHPEPADLREHERIFGCRPAFDAPVNELVFPRAIADVPLTAADAALGRYLEPVAEARLAALSSADRLLADVSRVVLAALPDGYPSIERVARKLGLSARSLQRRLEERSTRYQDVVDNVRHQAALRLLDDASLSVAEVAFLLGFSDASGFQRAFRRWTGRAPRRGRAAS